MPVLRIIAGPDGADPVARSIPLGDPAAVTIDGLRVVTVEDTSLLPMSRELRDARERAVGALAAAGARARRVSLRSWRGATLPFLVTLQSGSRRSRWALLQEAGERSVLRGEACSGPAATTRCRRGSRWPPELLPQPGDSRRRGGCWPRPRARRRALRGDRRWSPPAPGPPACRATTRSNGRTSVADHPRSRVQPRRRPGNRSAARALAETGVPLGVQVAAGMDRDHVSIAVALELERTFGGWVAPTSARGPVRAARADDDVSPWPSNRA